MEHEHQEPLLQSTLRSPKECDRGLAASPPDPALIFVHMFKSGGSTFNRIIDWEYNPLRIFSVNGRYRLWGYKRLLECPPSLLAKMQVFRGHMPFGLHQFLPQRSTYMTVLRDPVPRTISSYFYALNRRIHARHRVVKRLTLDEFVERLAPNNFATKALAGSDRPDDFVAAECTAATLARAKANLLNHFSLIGITERFEDTLALAKVLLGWKISRYASFNVTPGPRRPISPASRALIARHNAFDIELYQYALTLFEETLARHEAQVQEARATVRRARLQNGPQLLGYRTASTALKLVSLGYSATRSMIRA